MIILYSWFDIKVSGFFCHKNQIQWEKCARLGKIMVALKKTMRALNHLDSRFDRQFIFTKSCIVLDHQNKTIDHWFMYGASISFQRDQWPSAKKIKSFELFSSRLAIGINNFENRPRDIWTYYEKRKKHKI